MLILLFRSLGYKSKRDKTQTGPSDMGATAYNEVETEKDKDAQAVYERSLEINKVRLIKN